MTIGSTDERTDGHTSPAAATIAGPGRAEHPAWSDGETDTVIDILRRAGRQAGDTLFLDFSGARYTYRDIWQAARVRAAGLRALGVGRGDTVVCLLGNSVDAVVTGLALNAVGGLWVPGDPARKGDVQRPQV
uniref:AMP-binding protein n=1 Tax=Nocardia farcinica TaxID=37329 RepID=UPI002458A34F